MLLSATGTTPERILLLQAEITYDKEFGISYEFALAAFKHSEGKAGFVLDDNYGGGVYGAASTPDLVIEKANGFLRVQTWDKDSGAHETIRRQIEEWRPHLEALLSQQGGTTDAPATTTRYIRLSFTRVSLNDVLIILAGQGLTLGERRLVPGQVNTWDVELTGSNEAIDHTLRVISDHFGDRCQVTPLSEKPSDFE